jgi:hypothetical protein
MPRRRSRGEVAIEATLANLEPGTERYQTLVAARDFKAAWVSLGERLTVVREQEQYKTWGYPSFEAYCRGELHLKAETANKLTRSFSYLRDHEGAVLIEREKRELPPLDVVDLLSRARERANVSDRQLEEIHEEVFDTEEGPKSRAEVLKRIREVDPDAFRAPQKPEKGPGDGDLRKALLLAERLQSLVEPHAELSRPARDGLRTLVSELRDVFEQTRKLSA